MLFKYLPDIFKVKKDNVRLCARSFIRSEWILDKLVFRIWSRCFEFQCCKYMIFWSKEMNADIFRLKFCPWESVRYIYEDQMRKNVADTSITRPENPVYIIRCTFLAWNDFIWCTYVGGCAVLLISATGCCSSSSLLHPPVIWFILREAKIKTETKVGRKDAKIK